MIKYFCDQCGKPSEPDMAIQLYAKAGKGPAYQYSEDEPWERVLTDVAVGFTFKSRVTRAEGRIDMCPDCRITLLEKILEKAKHNKENFRGGFGAAEESDRVLREARERAGQRKADPASSGTWERID